MPSLDPRQTASVLTAVQRRTVRAAAEQLGPEPSTVSRNILALEAGLAMTLKQRGRSGVRPTEAGALLHRQEGEWELLRCDCDDLASMKRGKSPSRLAKGLSAIFFDNALARFSAMYRDITFALIVGSTAHVVQQVTSDQAHLGLAYDVA